MVIITRHRFNGEETVNSSRSERESIELNTVVGDSGNNSEISSHDENVTVRSEGASGNVFDGELRQRCRPWIKWRYRSRTMLATVAITFRTLLVEQFCPQLCQWLRTGLWPKHRRRKNFQEQLPLNYWIIRLWLLEGIKSYTVFCHRTLAGSSMLALSMNGSFQMVSYSEVLPVIYTFSTEFFERAGSTTI